MSSLEKSVRLYMEQSGLRFIKAEDANDFRVDYTMDNFIAHGRIVFDEQRNFVGFMVSGSIKVAFDRRVDAMEYITRANYGLNLGGFQMDFDDGDILFRTGLFIGEAEPTPALIDPLIQVAIRTYDRYYKGLMEVLYAGKSPAEAVQEAEKNGPSQEEVDQIVETLLRTEDETPPEEEKPRPRRKRSPRRPPPEEQPDSN